MAGTALKIDDDYVLDMGTTLSDNETELQSGVDKYLEIMKKIREDAIKEGETGELKNVITEHGVNVNKTCQKFKAEIDENDQYLF